MERVRQGRRRRAFPESDAPETASLMNRRKMNLSAYAILTTLLTLLGVVGLLSLRLVGLYSHQALAVVLLLGCGWAVVSRVWLAWKGRLHLRPLRGFRARDSRSQLLQAVGRASFWAAASVACLAVFPRSATGWYRTCSTRTFPRLVRVSAAECLCPWASTSGTYRVDRPVDLPDTRTGLASVRGPQRPHPRGLRRPQPPGSDETHRR